MATRYLYEIGCISAIFAELLLRILLRTITGLQLRSCNFRDNKNGRKETGFFPQLSRKANLRTKHQLALIKLYKPLNANKGIFIGTMNIHLNNLLRTKTIDHVVCGDFNINVLNTSFKASWLVQIMESYDFSLKNHQPTRPRRIYTSLIDLRFANFTLFYGVDQTGITSISAFWTKQIYL